MEQLSPGEFRKDIASVSVTFHNGDSLTFTEPLADSQVRCQIKYPRPGEGNQAWLAWEIKFTEGRINEASASDAGSSESFS